jgi:hypothetical protein
MHQVRADWVCRLKLHELLGSGTNGVCAVDTDTSCSGCEPHEIIVTNEHSMLVPLLDFGTVHD